MKVDVFNTKGEKVGDVELPKGIFEIPLNQDLLHQVVTSQRANTRVHRAATKGRGEVRGGGKKPWKQKGTGRARHGSIRSPLWRKGGVTFGPTVERDYTKKINKKMKRKALFMVLSRKARDGHIIILDDLTLREAKTKHMAEVFENLRSRMLKNQPPGLPKKDTKRKPKKPSSILLVLPVKDDMIIRASRNIPRTGLARADSLNLFDLLSFSYILVPQKSVDIMAKTFLNTKKDKKA